jgi:cupin 2 domain-containing protein
LVVPGVRFERIVSHGHVSPDGFWYDQDDDEWVVVIEGEGELQIEGESTPRRLQPGDWLFLPAHCRHRVVSTAEGGPTVWLAVHIERS